MRRCCGSCLRLQIVPAVRMLTLYLGQSFRVVETVVEGHVHVRRLVTQYGSEGRAVGREAPVTVMDVFAVCDGSLDSPLCGSRNPRRFLVRLPPAARARPAPEDSLRTEFAFYERAHGGFHRRVVRRAVGFEENLAASLQAERVRHWLVAAQQPQRRGEEPVRAEVLACLHLSHPEPQCLEPAELVSGEVGIAA